MVIHLVRRVKTRRKLRIEERDSGKGTTSARHAASLALGMMAVDDVFESLLVLSPMPRVLHNTVKAAVFGKSYIGRSERRGRTGSRYSITETKTQSSSTSTRNGALAVDNRRLRHSEI